VTPPAEKIKTGTATILIVDDEAPNRKLLEVLLRHEGYHTVSVGSGKEALDEVARRPPDLILLDVMMPGTDVYQLAKLLKSDRDSANIPVVMVTAQADQRAQLAGLEAGAEDFLTKPIDRVELSLRIRNLLRLKAYGDFLEHHGALLQEQVTACSADLLRFRTAMDASADGIVMVSRASMRFVEMNATACSMLGYSRDQLLQMGPADLDGTTPEQVEAMYDLIIAGQKTTATTESIRRPDGSELPVEVHRHAQASGDDWIIVGVIRDITERVAVEWRLHHLAHYDALTGLPNRTLFHEALGKALTLASHRGWTVGVLFLDLDHFKHVNDTLGRASGDEIIIQAGDRLTGCVRIRDTVGRLGGDEFGLILLMEAGQQGASAVAEQIRKALRVPFDVHGRKVTITASIGITVNPTDAGDPDTLLKYADTAMYRAKQAGRDTVRFFTAEMNNEMLRRHDLEMALHRAVANGEFVLHYQPKVDLDSGRVAGLEALLRWQRPGHGLVSPADFIPLLEETGLIVDVGRWVITTVCQQINRWLQSPVGPLQVAVNVSGRQFVDGDLEADVIGALDANGVPAALLELELTESSLMANTERTVATLERLKAIGVQISIDDFGTGYSSLAYLRRFPIDKLKIDITFIRDITSDPDDAAIARTIIRMAHSLRLEVIAEGVETAAQVAYLRRHHCDEAQGFYFSRPLSVSGLEVLLAEGGCLGAADRSGGASPKTLLLVDDDADALDLLHGLLQQDGYRILTATSGAEGLEMLARNEVQVVVSDQRMPAMSGSQFLDRVKDLHPDTLRIILSGYADFESIIDAINCGAIYRFYKKPWAGNVIRNDIRDAFRHQARMHDRPPEDVTTAAAPPTPAAKP
jgi:diguanylate cyclase (GGDEF)-like protein/PAS domain S-box-containing protein